jgi:hypothetical protein
MTSTADELTSGRIMRNAYEVAADYLDRRLRIQHLDLRAVMLLKRRDPVAWFPAGELPFPLRYPWDIG